MGLPYDAERVAVLLITCPLRRGHFLCLSQNLEGFRGLTTAAGASVVLKDL